MITLRLLLVIVGVATQSAVDKPKRLAFDQPVSVDVLPGTGSADPTVPGPLFEVVPTERGRAYVAAEGGPVDPSLAVQGTDGHVLATDDDSGGGRSAFLEFDVSPNAALRLVLRWKPSATGGAIRLVARFAPSPTAEEVAAIDHARTSIAEAGSLAKEGKRNDARDRIEKAVATVLELARAETLAEAHDVLVQAGTSALAIGALESAGKAFDVALRFDERVRNEDHPTLQKMRIHCSTAHYELGDLNGALAFSRKALDSRLRTLAEDAVPVQEARTEVGNSLVALGQISEAGPLLARVLEVYTAKLPDDAPSLQTARQNMANVYAARGDFVSARELDEKVLAVRERIFPDDSLPVQDARGNLASDLVELGDVFRARPLREKVLEVVLRTLPEEHPAVCRARTSLADSLSAVGELASARKLLEAVVAIDARRLDPSHPDRLLREENLGVLCRQLDDLPRARELLEEVLTRREALGPEDAIALQNTRVNLVGVASYQKDASRARELADRAMAIARNRVPRNVGEIVHVASAAAWVYRDLGRDDEVANLAIEIASALREQSLSALTTSAPREAEARSIEQLGGVSRVLSIARLLQSSKRGAELNDRAFTLVETTRGVGLRSSELLRRAAAVPTTDNARTRLLAACSEVARLTRSRASREEILAATGARDAAQRAVIKALLGSDSVDDVIPTPARIAARLGPGRAAVSFAIYQSYEPAADQPKGFKSTTSFLAFVVRSDRPLARVELGDADLLAKTVVEWRRALGVSTGVERRGIGAVVSAGDPPRSESAVRAELGRRLVGPLLPALDGVHSVVVVPDGMLELVPFEAMPVAQVESSTPELFGDRFAVEERSTLWELLDASSDRVRASSVVLVGGIDYDSAPAAATESHTTSFGAPATLTRSAAAATAFRPLPGAVREIGSIERLARSDPKADVLVLDKSQATVDAFASRSSKALVLHVATHGFFGSAVGDDATEKSAVGVGSEFMSSRADQVAALSPLSLCGLAFAGANLPQDACGQNRNVLTAEEIAALDLRGCELAVLSACSTGVGHSREGQGLASLRRALQMAGARCVITSLWDISDDYTEEFMVSFYRRALLGGVTVSRAFHDTTREMRDRRGPDGRPKYALRDWAGFVLTGDATTATLKPASPPK